MLQYKLMLTYMGVSIKEIVVEDESDLPAIEDDEEVVIDGRLYTVYDTRIIYDFDLNEKRIVLSLIKGSNKE